MSAPATTDPQLAELAAHLASLEQQLALLDSLIAGIPASGDAAGVPNPFFIGPDGSTQQKTAELNIATLPPSVIGGLVGADGVEVRSVWGIDANGEPYFGPQGAAVGESALLSLDSLGNPVLTQIGA